MLTSVSDYVIRGIKNLTDGIVSSVENLGTTIVNGIKDIFVPSEDFLSDKVDSIRSRFVLADSISDTAGVIIDFFNTVAQGEPPKIEIHLNTAEGGIYFGDVAYALDMTWYERYKPSVDLVLSSMMWVFFVWRVFTRLPNIINGVGSDGSDKINTIMKG